VSDLFEDAHKNGYHLGIKLGVGATMQFSKGKLG
jgi:hypothetical protein